MIGEGDSGFATLQVTDGAELVIRGPATIRVHDLRLDGGSLLTLDTRDGDVELFVTGELSMDPASYVETTALTSKEVSISASALEDMPAPPLTFEGTSQFYGTIYAPESTVRIGSNFEIFGSAVGRRLEVAAGARLHFDDESYNGELAVPRQESWQLIEIPSSSPRAQTPGVAGNKLADAHQLDDVDLSIRYLDTGGLSQSYAGPESGFDWSDVESVEAEERIANYDRPRGSDPDGVFGATDESIGSAPGDSGNWSGGDQFWEALLSFAQKAAADYEARRGSGGGPPRGGR